jgi:hypothetical protein
MGAMAGAGTSPKLMTHPRLQAEVEMIAQLLPAHLFQTIGKTTRIEFTALDRHKQAYFGCESPKPKSPVVAAKIYPSTARSQNPTIYVHQGYLELLKKSPLEIRCGRTIREHFQKTVIHELAHLFDLLAPQTNAEMNFANKNCKANSGSKNASICRHIRRKFQFSESAQYLALDNWSDHFKSKNTETNDSPDPYALTAARESFAVHFEAFVTDPNFACHKPALARYFSTIFKQTKTCANMNTKVISRNEVFDLNPDRLFEVHYLYAAPGSTMPSRWGHSMLRFVFCSPSRAYPSTECLKDVSHHRVISFRANIEDFQLNNWKALTGKYPSQLFILSLSEVVNEYTQVELRRLISPPLQLSTIEKTMLVEKVLENYWNYKGRYYFLSNNCADETFALLAGVFFERHVLDMQKFTFSDAGLITPKELYQFYKQIGLAAKKPTDRNLRLALGYEFSSGQESLDKAMRLLKQRAPDTFASHKRFADFLANTSAVQRQELFYSSLFISPANTRALATALYILESNQLGRLQSQARKEIAKLIDDGHSDILSLTGKIKIDYLNTYENQVHNQPITTYGVPLLSEWDQWVTRHLAQSENTPEQDAQNDPELISLLQKVIPNLMKELAQSENNISLFLNYIKQSKQQTKGDI